MCECKQDDLDPVYRQMNRERSAKAAAKTRTMQVLAEAPSSQQIRSTPRISFGNKASSIFLFASMAMETPVF